MLPVNWTPADAQVRSFSRLWWPLFVVVVSVVLYRRVGLTPVVQATIGTAVVVTLLAALNRRVGRVLFLALQVITYPIALVTSTVVLAGIYYLVVTPIGLALRVTGRDALALRRRPSASQWIPVNHDKDAERAFRQF